MTKHIPKLFLLGALIFSFSFTVSAQDQDGKKGEKREPPQIRVPKDKKPKDKDSDKKNTPKPQIVLGFVEAKVEYDG